MRKILQDNINARNDGNFGSLPANARKLALAVQRVIEQFIVLRNNHLWWHFVKHQLSHASIEEEKIGESRNPTISKWSSIWQGYLICS